MASNGNGGETSQGKECSTKYNVNNGPEDLTVKSSDYVVIAAAEIVHNISSVLITGPKQTPLCMVTTCLFLEDITSLLL